jgi:molybdopterin-synthase adenylyltransferase
MSCLVCNPGLLSPQQVRSDLSSDAQRRADPYFLQQSDIKQPAVITLNSTAASLAATMFLGAVAGIPFEARQIRIRGVRGDVRVQEAESRPDCINCSAAGNLGAGDSVQLPGRSR